MKNPIFNKIFVLVGVLLLLICTYFRENLLLEINALIGNEEFNRAYNYWFIDFFKSIPKGQLIYWKWGVTIFFSLLMPLISVVSLHFWFFSNELTKLVSIIYVTVLVVVFLLGIIAFTFNCFDLIYLFLRRILGVIQSPFPFFIIVALVYAENKRVKN